MNLIAGNSSEIRIAIAGMGKMGGYHLNALQQLAAGVYEDYYKGNVNEYLSKIKIVGICDISPEKAKKDNIRSFSSAASMLKQISPDILIIAAPTETHLELAKMAIQNGVHTFVEKPIVAKSAQLNELINLAQEKGCRLMAGHIERYNPVSIKIVSLLKDKNPLTENYSFVRTQRHDSRIPDDIITDKVIHDLDLSLYFFGAIKKIKVNDYKLVDGKTYEISLSTEHQNGIKGNLFVSWLNNEEYKKREVQILQGGHKWKGDFVSKQLWVDDMEIKCQVNGMIKPANNQIKDELVDFIASCIEPLENIVPLLSMDEIIDSTKWLEEINLQIGKI
ncbi:MAG: hypothetical protein A2Y10_05765 [Planctomycetes bacterium GWF2_41_51]|nr:MAG: hypothetical protein A2Y10_05765 [Planctomycetes bacterium GWF2_41_51]